jgi:hypothetical protein
MPMLSRNSSWGSGSGGVSEVEDVEEQEQAPVPAAAPAAAAARRPRTGQRDMMASRALLQTRPWADRATRDAKRAGDIEQKRIEEAWAKAGEEKKQAAALARRQAREHQEAARKAQPIEEEEADAALMAQTIADIGSDIAEVLEGMPPRSLRKEVTSMARLFEATWPLVDVDNWNPRSVLPTLQTHLQLGAHAMGQSMTALLDQHGHVKGMTRVYLTLSAIAAATKGSSGGSGAARASAPGEVRVNGSLQKAMEALGSKTTGVAAGGDAARRAAAGSGEGRG